MAEDPGVEPSLPFRVVAVFKTVANRFALSSVAESRRIELRRAFTRHCFRDSYPPLSAAL